MNNKQQKILELQAMLNGYPCVPARIKSVNGGYMVVYPFFNWVDENGTRRYDVGVQEGSTPKWCVEFIKWISEPKMKEFRKVFEDALVELLAGQQTLSFLEAK